MILYEGWRSSASWRVRWALALKGVPYQSVWIDVAAGEHHRTLAPVTPAHQVPTLVLDDGRPLSESVAIIEWLDETRPSPPLLPKDPLARAHVRELVQLINAGTHPLQNTRVRKALELDEAAGDAWARRWIEEGLGVFEKRIQGAAGRFCAGDALTMADLFLIPQVRNAERFGAALGAWPNVQRIYRDCLARPEVQRTDPNAMRLLAEAK